MKKLFAMAAILLVVGVAEARLGDFRMQWHQNRANRIGHRQDRRASRQQGNGGCGTSSSSVTGYTVAPLTIVPSAPVEQIAPMPKKVGAASCDCTVTGNCVCITGQCNCPTVATTITFGSSYVSFGSSSGGCANGQCGVPSSVPTRGGLFGRRVR